MTEEFKYDPVQPKYVRIMADYCATAFWDSNGCNREWDFVPCSPALIAGLAVWVADWEDANWSSDKEDKECVWKGQDRWEMWGRKLVEELRKELPDWTIELFDEENMAQIPNPEKAILHNGRLNFFVGEFTPRIGN